MVMTKQINIFTVYHLLFNYNPDQTWVKMDYSWRTKTMYMDYLDRLRTENSYLASWAYKKGRR